MNNLTLNQKLSGLNTARGKLSEREKEVLLLIASQMTTKEIALQLFISPGTVESHRKNILQKLQVKNTVGLIIKSIHEGYIKISENGTVVI